MKISYKGAIAEYFDIDENGNEIAKSSKIVSRDKNETVLENGDVRRNRNVFIAKYPNEDRLGYFQVQDIELSIEKPDDEDFDDIVVIKNYHKQSVIKINVSDLANILDTLSNIKIIPQDWYEINESCGTLRESLQLSFLFVYKVSNNRIELIVGIVEDVIWYLRIDILK